jgi:homoserine kinase
MRTAEARSVLPAQVTRAVAVAQAANAAATVAALAAGDYDLLRRSLVDLIAEPVRAPLLPGFREARDAALAAGAHGSSISGSGPTVFALARGDAAGATIAAAMYRAYVDLGIACEVRVARVDREGARVISGGAS